MKSLFKYVALETFPICLGFSPAREGGSSIVRNRVPSAETSLQRPGASAGGRAARPAGSSAKAGRDRAETPALPSPCHRTHGLLCFECAGHLRRAALPSLYIMIIGYATGKSAAKGPIFYFSDTAQLKVY